jgi:hypothetical protein
VILEAGATEAAWRSAVSRAYYVMKLYGRDVLKQVTWRP